MSRADAPARHLVIAVDGPAASGKSSTAQAVAVALGIRHADSGAFYRAATLARLQPGDEPPWTEQSVLDAVRDITIALEAATFEPRLRGARVLHELHGASVTARVSALAKMPRVRAWVNGRMRECATKGDLVVDGRDMGTAVFPDARVKVYLVAHAEVRAHRRSLQRLERVPTDEELREEHEAIVHRDSKDATQSLPAEDAVLIDTTDLTQAEVVARIVALTATAGARKLGQGGGHRDKRPT